MIRTKQTTVHSVRRRQRGVSLVESLVALVVISAGMLGIAAMYVETMRANRSALSRLQAVQLVNDMTDRIRANPRARASYNSGAYGSGPVLRNCVATSNCSAAYLAEDDLARWILTVNETLPTATAREVIYQPVVGGLDSYRVRVVWQEAGEGASGAAATLTYENVFEMIPVIL